MQTVDKIIKLLALTDSSNDNEAISAFRIAKKIMIENNINWSDLTVSKSFFSANPQKTDSRYQDKSKSKPDYASPNSEKIYKQLKYLQMISKNVSVNEIEIIISLVQYFEDKDYLTKKQCDLAYGLIKKNKHL